ncbi:hypothetical protein CAP36_08915 [Chitinophagaceae bacterium IBVUCB2]|nr:hypothetical protein CAP36_08915 [Chitinophagaceae bacterium IBVUCB2]
MKSILLVGALVFFSGSSFSQTWAELNRQVLELNKRGEFNEAISVAEKAVEAAKNEFGLNNNSYASSLNNLAYLYENMAQYEKARPLYILATEIRKKILGENHPSYALSLNNLASLYVNMGQYQNAETLFLQSLEITKKISGDNNLDYAVSLSNLGNLYSTTGEYNKAEPLNLQVLKIIKNVSGDINLDYATSLNNLGNLYLARGQYEKAEPAYLQLLEILQKVLGKNQPEVAIGLNNLAYLYASLGQYEKAESFYLQALEIMRKVVGENHTGYASSLGGLAILYKSAGLYEKAESLFFKAGEIFKKTVGENHLEYALNLNNSAKLYAIMNQYEKAEPLFLKTREIFKKAVGEKHPAYVESLNNLGYVYDNMFQYEKAKPLYLQAIEAAKRISGKTHPSYISSLNNLALLYQRSEDFEKAEPLFTESRTIQIKNMLAVFNNLSENEKSNYLAYNVDLNNTQNSLLYVYYKANNDILRENYNLQLLLKSLTLSSTKYVVESVRTNNDTLVQNIFDRWQNKKSILSKQYSLPIATRREDLSKIEYETEMLEKELTRKSSAFKNQQQSLQLKINEVQKNLQQNEVAIEFVRFNLFNKKWTDSTLYAAYVLTKNNSAPIFIPLCEEKQLQKLFDSAGTTASAMVSQFYRGLELKKKNTTGALGTELYKLIWQPLEPYLKNVKKISYSPAGKLYSIAFHALPVDSTTVLMDKFQLQQYTSTRQVVLREQEKQNSKPQYITLFGDASFTLDSLQLVKQKIYNPDKNNISTSIYTPKKRSDENNTWSSLPGTAQEVKTIQQVFEQNKITTKSFTQITASEENLKALSGNSPQILHIATHGFFLPESDKKKKTDNFNNENTYTLADDPLLRSGLVLAGGNYAWSGKPPIDGIEDGIATAYEISQLNLSNTEIVVLSACETALGDVKGSEGVFGLQRAFKMAGVKKMIVSLWQVPDKETAELMTSFYSYWMKDKTINDAFTQAQADMRKKYSPFYWAAFVLVE